MNKRSKRKIGEPEAFAPGVLEHHEQLKPAEPGPRGKTVFGTELEAIRSNGCGLLFVRRIKDGEEFLCTASAITGNTPKDQKRLKALANA